MTSFPESCLLQGAVESSGRYIDAGLAGDRHGSRLGRMMELAMASLHANLEPTVLLKQSNQFCDFQRGADLRQLYEFSLAFPKLTR